MPISEFPFFLCYFPRLCSKVAGRQLFNKNERFVICVATACWKHATSDELYLARLRYHPEHMHIYKVRDSTQLGSYNIHSSKCSLSTMVHGLRHCYIDNLVCTLISCIVEHFPRRWNQIFPQHMYKFQTHIPCKTISIGWYSNEHPRFKHACRWCESVLCGTCLDWYMFFSQAQLQLLGLSPPHCKP